MNGASTMHQRIATISAGFTIGAVFGALALTSATGHAATTKPCNLTRSESRTATRTLAWIAAQDTASRQADAYPALHEIAQKAQQTLDAVDPNGRCH